MGHSISKEELKQAAEKVMKLEEFEALDLHEWQKGSVRRAMNRNGYHLFILNGERVFVEL